MPQDVIELSLPLGQRTYKIKVSTHKESQIRKGVTELNAIINTYKKDFPNQAEHDYLSMAFIGYLANQQSASGTTDSNLIEALKALNTQL
jgi:hypothetical protein